MAGIGSEIGEMGIQTNQNHSHQPTPSNKVIDTNLSHQNEGVPTLSSQIQSSGETGEKCRKRKRTLEKEETPHQKKSSSHEHLTKEFSDICISCQTSMIIDEQLMTRFEELVNDERVDVTSIERDRGISPLFTLIHYLSAHPNVFELAQLLILKGVDVNGKGFIVNHEDLTPLHALSENEKLSGVFTMDLVHLLIKNGADVNIKDGIAGRSPLYNFCCYYKNDNLDDILQLLIESGADVNAKDKYGSTPLHELCKNYRKNNFIHLARLIENGANVNPEGYESPLFLLCGWQVGNENLIHLVRLLIEEGADVTVGWNGRTPLHALCQNYRIDELLLDIVKVMVRGNGVKRADMSAKDSKGLTPLQILRNRGFFCVIT